MKLANLADACLYFLAGSVILAVVAAFAGQMSEGATAEEYQENYEKVSEPIILTATESAEVSLEEAVASCVNGVCGAVKNVQENKPVRSTVRSSCQRVRRGIFFRWSRR